GGIEVVADPLPVLAGIPLGTGQAEQPPLQDRIAPVPQAEREAHARLPVRDAEQAVLSPAIRPAAGVVVREVVPYGPVGRVVLAHRSPLALGQIRSPALPVLVALRVLRQAAALGAGRHPACPAADSLRSRSCAALMRARWVKACGKLPRCCACGPSSSPYSPRWFA